MQPHADVDLAAGGWAVLGVLLLAALLTAVLRPALTRRRPEVPVCNTPGSQGRHPLGEPDQCGVRRCGCGAVTRIPPAPRTDTREHSWPGLSESMPGNPGELLARASGHPTVWEAPTEEAPLPHLVWPPRD